MILKNFDIENLEKVQEEVINKFPVILTKDSNQCHMMYGGPTEDLQKAQQQWKEIDQYLRREHHLSADERNLLFVVLRGHYNWSGWAPSIRALYFLVNLK